MKKFFGKVEKRKNLSAIWHSIFTVYLVADYFFKEVFPVFVVASLECRRFRLQRPPVKCHS